MADGEMPPKQKRKTEKKQKKRVPAERIPMEPATGKLGDIFEAMRNSSAVGHTEGCTHFGARGASQ